MKEIEEVNYDNLNLKGDEQVFHMWEPLNFEIKDDYKYIIDNRIFNAFSDLLAIIATPILWIINIVLFGFDVQGVDNLRKVSGGKVTISNHIHPMDCTMNGLINFPERTYFPTLATNFKIPFIRHLIRILYAIPIPKKVTQKEKFFEEIKKALLDGKTVHMYPEAALWPYYEKLRPFKKGAFKMAVDAKCPIVPILYEFKEPDGIFALYKRKKCIHARVLEPVYPNLDLNDNDMIEDLQNRVMEAYHKYCN